MVASSDGGEVANKLFDEPPIRELPVSRGGDIVLHVSRRSDEGEPDPWPEGTEVWLQLTPRGVRDSGGDLRFDGARDDSGSYSIIAESEVADELRDESLWALIVQFPGMPRRVALNGEVRRYDGRL